MNWVKNIHWHAVGAAALTVIGVVSSPAALALIPAKYAVTVALTGMVAQGLSKPIVKPDTPTVANLPNSQTPATGQ